MSYYTYVLSTQQKIFLITKRIAAKVFFVSLEFILGKNKNIIIIIIAKKIIDNAKSNVGILDSSN